MAKLEKKSFTRKVNESLFEDFFTTEAERSGTENSQGAVMIPLNEIDPFPNHPFQVRYDEDMEELISSIRERGVLSPVLVRKTGSRYQMISGHRRKMASEYAGLTEIPATVVSMTDDEATVAMVETNFHRPKLLPSEKAFSYKMRYDALKHQGKRTDLEESTSDQIEQKLTAADKLAENTDTSSATMRRLIRLTYLNRELLDMVDSGKLGLTQAVDISMIPSEDQVVLLDAIKMLNKTPSIRQAKDLKEYCRTIDHTLTKPEVIGVFAGPAPKVPGRISIPVKKLKTVIPDSVNPEDYEDYILAAVRYYSEKN